MWRNDDILEQQVIIETLFKTCMQFRDTRIIQVGSDGLFFLGGGGCRKPVGLSDYCRTC